MRTRAKSRCSICNKVDHNKATCKFRGLAIWSNGSDLWIANSPLHASRLEGDMIASCVLPEFTDEIRATPTQGWHQVRAEPLRLEVDGKPDQWCQRAWIVANGAGLLALDGLVLAPGRRAP